MPDTRPLPAEASSDVFAGRIPLHGRTIREHTAAGTLVNGAFQAGIVTLAFLKGVVVAAFLSPSEYGVWGILVISLMTFTWLRQVGVSDKFVQQDEADQERAWQRAFTLELIFTGAIVLLFAAAVPLIGLVYGEVDLVAPGLVMAATLALGTLNAPTWIFYRRMDFVRQRTLLAIEPVVGFVATVALAVAGAGYWSLVLGALAGALVSSVVILLASPYRVRLRYDHGTAKQYVSFSWPLIVAGGAGLVIAQGSVVAGESVAGLAGAGAIALAATIAAYSDRVDQIVTQALYPAICAVRDRKDLLYESFVKSNRLTLIWGVPFGVGLSLFAADLVEFGFGDGWEPAVALLRVFGLTAAVGHIGFNWDAFYRARGDTRPIAVCSGLTMLAFLAVPLPLLLTDGLEAFAIGIAVMAAVTFAIKGYYLTRLFSGFRMLAFGARAMAPVVPAVAVVFVARALEGSGRGVGTAAAELALYVAVCVAATWFFERALLREVGGYLRGSLQPSPRAAAPISSR